MMAKKKAKLRRYPPLPTSVMGAGGLLEVAVVAKVDTPSDDSEDVLGVFKPTLRRIEVAKSLRGDQKWLVFYHELTHAALWDSGAANAMTEAVQEAVCDSVSTAMLRARFG